MVQYDPAAPFAIDARRDPLACLQFPELHASEVQDSLAGFLRIVYDEGSVIALQHARITNLAAALAIERRRCKNDRALLAVLQYLHSLPFAEQGRNNRLLFYTVIAAELALFVDLDARRGLTAEFAGRTGAITLCRHRGLETFLVYAKPAFACDVRGQVDRKAIGVVQLEHHVARQFLALQSGDRFLEDLHPLVESLGEPGLFLRQHLFNVCPRLDEFRVSVAHFLAQ